MPTIHKPRACHRGEKDKNTTNEKGDKSLEFKAFYKQNLYPMAQTDCMNFGFCAESLSLALMLRIWVSMLLRELSPCMALIELAIISRETGCRRFSIKKMRISNSVLVRSIGIPSRRISRLRILTQRLSTVSYTHLTLPTIIPECRSRWSPYH